MEKKPKYIENVGWRFDVEHNHKRRHRTHRYNDVGTYLITIVVKERKPVFGFVKGDVNSAPTDQNYPKTILSSLGEKVIHEELHKIHSRYPMTEIWSVCMMPDHIHLILRINEMLPKNKFLGNIIGAFKGGVSRAWGYGSLFEGGYNDRILMRQGQLDNWKAYLDANPYRWLVRRTHPEVMQRALCLEINGIRYGAFGNFLLLRYPEKERVFFHRRMPDDLSADSLTSAPQCVRRQPNINPQLIPTEQTRFWQNERKRLMSIAEQGDVLVTPGISECEKLIKNECLQNHHRLIHLQTEPIGNYWKPERSRFDACAAGTLLILAPWKDDLHGSSDYERFHNLNTLAENICKLGQDAKYVVKKTTV